jgi:hypothetical protein
VLNLIRISNILVHAHVERLNTGPPKSYIDMGMAPSICVLRRYIRMKSTTGIDIQVKSSKSDAIPNRKADTKLVSSFEVVTKGMSAPDSRVVLSTWKEWENRA